MYILGISAYYHDSAASLIHDGKVIAACQEERLSRIKNDSQFPKLSIQFCLNAAGITPQEIQHIVFYEKPFIKFERLIETYISFAPKGFPSFSKAIPIWLNEKLFQKKLISENLIKIGFTEKHTKNLLFSEHHLSHAASCFYPSPFKDAIILTMDGVGEWETTSVFLGKNKQLTKVKEIRFPHSLGLLYSAFTYHCGFTVNSGEYKLMGLAPYGKPIFVEKIKTYLIDIKDDGSFKINQDYFDYCVGLTMTNEKFNELFDNSFRSQDQPLKQIHMDLAASIQNVLEEVVIKICYDLKKQFSINNLCLAGGVALNCVANGKIQELKIFENIWIQPAAGDAGGSLGAAYTAYYNFLDQERVIDQKDSMNGAYLGPSFSVEHVRNELNKHQIVFDELTIEQIQTLIAVDLKNQKTVGWFQGNAEFGPRALGNRSILADPRSELMQKNLNLKIKFRESFRPFAPAVLEEEAENWFKISSTSPYMLLTAQILDSKKIQLTEEELKLFGIELLNRKRSVIPAVTHVDYSARLQTVSKVTNPKFHGLISEFYKQTGCPIIVNTSFNVRGEPIVCAPQEALNCFFATDIDILVMENFVIRKENQNVKFDFKNKMLLD